MTRARQPVIIDCDPGIDDALALLLALRSPELDVRAVTVVAGNVGLPQCVANARRICALATVGAAAPPPPVYAGAARALVRPPIEAGHVHGADGLGGLAAELLPLESGLPPAETLSAPEAILAAAAASPGRVTLITLGPLTNAALALQRNPSRFRHLAEIVVMGGAFAVHGNVTAVAEFNIFADPHAAQAVLGAGIPVRMVGLDVTTQAILRAEDRARAAAHPVASLAARLAEAYSVFYRPHLGDACYLHDPLAVACVIDPSLVEMPSAAVAIETEGKSTLGMTVVDRRPWSREPRHTRISAAVDAGRFLRLFHERVLA